MARYPPLGERNGPEDLGPCAVEVEILTHWGPVTLVDHHGPSHALQLDMEDMAKIREACVIFKGRVTNLYTSRRATRVRKVDPELERLANAYAASGNDEATIATARKSYLEYVRSNS